MAEHKHSGADDVVWNHTNYSLLKLATKDTLGPELVPRRYRQLSVQGAPPGFTLLCRAMWHHDPMCRGMAKPNLSIHFARWRWDDLFEHERELWAHVETLLTLEDHRTWCSECRQRAQKEVEALLNPSSDASSTTFPGPPTLVDESKSVPSSRAQPELLDHSPPSDSAHHTMPTSISRTPDLSLPTPPPNARQVSDPPSTVSSDNTSLGTPSSYPMPIIASSFDLFAAIHGTPGDSE